MNTVSGFDPWGTSGEGATWDGLFRPDDDLHSGVGPENLAVIRRLAQNILRLHPSPKSISRKMRAAMWSKDFFFELFTHMR